MFGRRLRESGISLTPLRMVSIRGIPSKKHVLVSLRIVMNSDGETLNLSSLIHFDIPLPVKKNDNWYWTLGEAQYRWLERSLQQSDAKFRFVFLHHLVGGADGNNRGCSEAAPFWEWGGKGASGEGGFEIKRPGWAKPMSAKSHFFRGAIALAVNGVPIFNPIKNDGRTDTLLAGELDQWGGHCGRGDDYHCHIGPVHLEKLVGVGEPIGVALDGYLLYGFEDSENLDWLNGQKDENNVYHYHSTKTYPYVNGGFFGEVVERGGQVDPQPRAQGQRPAMWPLRSAKITEFENPSSGHYVLRYEVSGDRQSVQYTVAGDGSVKFNFVSRRGTTTENYSPRPSDGNRGRRNANPPPRQDRRPVGNQMANHGSRPRRGGGDPIVNALDANGDGRINKAELRKAGASLRKLDKNKDGQITSDELRGPGGGGRGSQESRAQGNELLGQSGKPRGLQSGDSPRQPWILVHADEIDLDRDKIISRKEIVGEAIKAFEGYDANHDDQLREDELSVRGGSRSAMGGFLKSNLQEIDRDHDGILTRPKRWVTPNECSPKWIATATAK